MTAAGAVALNRCRGCGSDDLTPVLDLGEQPVCDHFPAVLDPGPDPRWPLALVLCGGCALVQLSHVSPAPEEPLAVESATLQAHAEAVTARLLARIDAEPGVRVREFASHHGGSWSAALVAGGCELVEADADVVVDNQSIIHAEQLEPELAQRVAALADDGLLVIEFHHAYEQLVQAQFDTVRHGHPLYFSLHSWSARLRWHGLSVVDAWREDVFGGCLVVLARRGRHEPTDAVREILAAERAVDLTRPQGYAHLAEHTHRTVTDLRDHITAAHTAGRAVAAYGAGSKAVTLLGVAGLGPDEIPIVADLSPGKHGRRIPGAGIPIVSPEQLVAAHPDDVVVLTWDIAPEVVQQLRSAGLTDARYVAPLPRLANVD